MNLMQEWQLALLSLALALIGTLLGVWWRQKNERWALILLVCVAAGIGLSWWSGRVFQVDDYRAGCDGVCAGFRGAPLAIYRNGGEGERLHPLGMIANCLLYTVIMLSWLAILRTIAQGTSGGGGSFWTRAGVLTLLALAPVVFSPFFLPPPEARVRGDSLRVAINARREVYLYDQKSPLLVLRSGLEDVRPRPDGQPGLRVCLRTYTFLYVPVGHITLDMTPEGVHSEKGEVKPLDASCWE